VKTKEDCEGSLYDIMRNKFNIKLLRYTESIEPILIDESISKYLNTPLGAPAILLNTITYTEGNIPVQYSHEIIRGDRAKFTVERDL
jgi:GntR family transcriptional regulator